MRKIKTLKKNYEYKNVLSKGKFYIGKQITIYITENRKENNVIGIAISTKTCNAVKRNKIKRLIREIYRLNSSNIKKGYNIVFLWNKNSEVKNTTFKIIEDEIMKIFKKADMFI